MSIESIRERIPERWKAAKEALYKETMVSVVLTEKEATYHGPWFVYNGIGFLLRAGKNALPASVAVEILKRNIHLKEDEGRAALEGLRDIVPYEFGGLSPFRSEFSSWRRLGALLIMYFRHPLWLFKRTRTHLPKAEENEAGTKEAKE